MFYVPAALAFYSALTFGCSEFAARVAVRHSSPYTGSLMQAVVHLLIFGLLSFWLFPKIDILNQGAWWFIASGVFDPALGVICYFAAFARIGVARAATMIGTSPVFSAAAAMLLLGERPNVWVWLGTLAIVAGGGALAYEPKVRVQQKSGFVYAILAAAFFGVAHTFRKAGLEFIPSSVVGMAVGNAGAFITLILVVPLLPAGSRLNTHPKGLAYYFLTSLGIALALFLLFEGLRLGSVSTVIPLVHTYPLMVILIAWIFLRKTEPITGRLLIGAALIVAGVATVTGLG